MLYLDVIKASIDFFLEMEIREIDPTNNNEQ